MLNASVFFLRKHINGIGVPFAHFVHHFVLTGP